MLNFFKRGFLIALCQMLLGHALHADDPHVEPKKPKVSHTRREEE